MASAVFYASNYADALNFHCYPRRSIHLLYAVYKEKKKLRPPNATWSTGVVKKEGAQLIKHKYRSRRARVAVSRGICIGRAVPRLMASLLNLSVSRRFFFFFIPKHSSCLLPRVCALSSWILPSCGISLNRALYGPNFYDSFLFLIFRAFEKVTSFLKERSAIVAPSSG